MRVKSLFLLLVCCLGLLPGVVQAEVDVDRPLEDALTLLYISEAVLEREANLDSAGVLRGVLAPARRGQAADPPQEILGRMIHATKQERNDLDANCRQLRARFQASGGEEAVKKLESYCKSERERLSNRIGLLRKLRGDRRRTFTRWWHSLKRGSANLWRRIGPAGRSILRKVGDEAFQTVASGGSLGGGVVKQLVKRAVTATAREQLKRAVYHGVERMLENQVRIAREAGVLDGEVEDDSLVRGPDQDDDGDLSLPSQQASGSLGEEGGCSAEAGWVTPYWEEEVRPALKAEGRACQRTAIAIYKACLQDQAARGVCPEEALKTCQPQYRAIPRDESSGAVTAVLGVMHSEAESVSASLVYQGSGGAVNGQINYTLKDSHLCTITVTSTLSGQFDLDTCTLQGTAQVTEVYEGSACASVCSADTCPVTKSAAVPWQATLEDGTLQGGVDGSGSEISGFGFGSR